jgi:hypothetical protein
MTMRLASLSVDQIQDLADRWLSAEPGLHESKILKARETALRELETTNASWLQSERETFEDAVTDVLYRGIGLPGWPGWYAEGPAADAAFAAWLVARSPNVSNDTRDLLALPWVSVTGR